MLTIMIILTTLTRLSVEGDPHKGAMIRVRLSVDGAPYLHI